ncbi:hypothetical protein CDAR_18421 [Caerostris darwini]|uniref:Uncharacterized protein n=1 Tax=Caerostris darwini TaxID=1538125 RepID=A0AAV4V9W3_9ARAC|nr:hypothetical protein CDAR_18421 [Caerostris darwini]
MVFEVGGVGRFLLPDDLCRPGGQGGEVMNPDPTLDRSSVTLCAFFFTNHLPTLNECRCPSLTMPRTLDRLDQALVLDYDAFKLLVKLSFLP